MKKLKLPECLQCSAQYVPTGNRQRFCSDECRFNFHNGVRKEKRAQARKAAKAS